MAPQYDVSGGRILTWALETHLADHCNLRCDCCCTLSPGRAEWFVDPEQLGRDLLRAATALRPHVLKLTGGEPLLHPALLRCLDAARASGIAERVSVTSNGLLLPTMPEGFFERIDRLTVSHYSSAPLAPRLLQRVVERCARHGVLLTVKSVDRFQRMDAEAPHPDDATAAAVFDACWLKLRCHTLYRGRFYACTRPPHLAAVRGGEVAPDDGVELAAPRLLSRLLAYLERDEPLAACRRCNGGGGAWLPHRQLGATRRPGFEARA